MDLEDSSTPPTRRVYRNPPIVEAIVELRFVGGAKWNLAVPGRFYELIKDDFPDEPEQREVVEASIGEGSSSDRAMFSVSRKEQRVLFRNQNQLVLIGPGSLSVNSLRPYEGWESLRSRVCDALTTYRSLVNPDAVSAIGVRYINRIELPARGFTFPDFFTIGLGLPEAGFPSTITSFFDRMELSYDEIPATIAFTWATAKSSKDDITALIVDLDLRWRESCAFDDVLDHVDELRSRERRAFESLINDRLREVFDADDSS